MNSHRVMENVGPIEAHDDSIASWFSLLNEEIAPPPLFASLLCFSNQLIIYTVLLPMIFMFCLVSGWVQTESILCSFTPNFPLFSYWFVDILPILGWRRNFCVAMGEIKG